MSDSISEEIEICSQATGVQPDTLSDGKDTSYTYRDFESTFVTTSRTTGKENSLDSSTTFQSHHVASTLSLDHSGEHSNVLSNTPSHTEEFPHQCSIQPYNPTGHEFYSKKLAVLKLKTVKDSSTAQSNGCHGNLNTTPSTHPAQDFVIQRLESNGDKLVAPSVNNTPPVSSPAQILMERLPTGQLERLRLEALKHRMSVMIEEVSNDLKEDSECTGCQEQLRLLAEKEFFSRKLKLITEPSILKRLEEHMYHKDTITMLGEVVRSCIRPSSTSETIWQALADKLDSLQKEHKT